MVGQVLETPFDLGQPAGQIIAIVFFLIPGLIATWMIERLVGRTALRPTERLLRAVALSVFLYVMASPWLLRLARRFVAGRPVSEWEPVIGFSLLLFVAPLALALIWASARRSQWFRKLIGRLTNIDPTPTSWDYVFSRGGPYMVRAKMRNGERVGGLFGPRSNASFYPEAQDLYLEKAWRLDEHGEFAGAIEDSEGVLLHRQDMDILELLKVRTGQEASDGESE